MQDQLLVTAKNLGREQEFLQHEVKMLRMAESSGHGSAFITEALASAQARLHDMADTLAAITADSERPPVLPAVDVVSLLAPIMEHYHANLAVDGNRTVAGLKRLVDFIDAVRCLNRTFKTDSIALGVLHAALCGADDVCPENLFD